MTKENFQIMEKNVKELPVLYVSTLAMKVNIVDQMLQVFLKDGRIIAVPLKWFSFLNSATPEQRAKVEIQAEGANLFWPAIGVKMNVMGLLAGADPCRNCWYHVSFYR